MYYDNKIQMIIKKKKLITCSLYHRCCPTVLQTANCYWSNGPPLIDPIDNIDLLDTTQK